MPNNYKRVFNQAATARSASGEPVGVSVSGEGPRPINKINVNFK